jgi:hypothetical protein
MNSPKNRLLKFAISCFFVLVTSVPSRAVVTGLINTGTDISGSLLPLGSVQTGWVIENVTPANPPVGLTPATPPSVAFVVNPHPAWIPNFASSASQWIGYTYPLYIDGDQYRDFEYRLPFQANVGDRFALRVAADNGVSGYLNDDFGNELFSWGPFDPPSDVPYQSWSPWIEVNGLAAGENAINLVVHNITQPFGNPTGLRVEFRVLPERINGALTLLPCVLLVAFGAYRQRFSV